MKGPELHTDVKSSEWMTDFMRNYRTHSSDAGFASQVGMTQINDGLSKSYLVGEKYLGLQHYSGGRGAGDKRTIPERASEDITRWASKPMPDMPAKQNGNGRPEAFNMLQLRHIGPKYRSVSITQSMSSRHSP